MREATLEGRLKSEKWLKAVRAAAADPEIRRKRGEAQRGMKKKKISKLAKYHDLMGTMPDTELAKIAGVSSPAIAYYRKTRGIPACVSKYSSRKPKKPKPNHKVVSVEPVGQRRVWDITVDHPDSNFPVGCGVFVHNSCYGGTPKTKLFVIQATETSPGHYPYLKWNLGKVEWIDRKWRQAQPEWEWKWEAQRQRFFRDGYIAEPLFGRREGALEGGKKEKVANTEILCVPGFTRILTDKGYVRIADLQQMGPFHAWTGKRWAPAHVVEQPPAEVYRTTTDRGVTFYSSADHKVLHVEQQRYAWKEISEIGTCSRLALDLARPLEFGLPNDHEVESAYHLGLWVADGHAYWKNHGFEAGITISNSKRLGRGGDSAVERMLSWGAAQGFNMNVSSKPGCRMLVWYKGAREWFDHWQCNAHAKAATKRVPERIWRSSLAARRAFLRGVLDGDGCWLSNKAVLSLCQREILEELWLLSRTVGVAGRVDGPFRNDHPRSKGEGKGCVIYRLVLSGDQCFTHLGWGGRATKTYAPRSGRLPLYIARHRVEDLRPRNKSDGVIQSRLRCNKQATTSPYVFQKMGVVDIYDHAEVRSGGGRNVVVPMYTLHVEDDEHRYVAEGIISKNCLESSIMSYMEERAVAALEPLGFTLRLDCHDSLTFGGPRKHEVEAKRRLREAMTLEMWRFGGRFSDWEVPYTTDSESGGTMMANWCKEELARDALFAKAKLCAG